MPDTVTSLMFPLRCGSQRTTGGSLCAPSTLDQRAWRPAPLLLSLYTLLTSLDASWSLCLRLGGGGDAFFQNGVHLCPVWQPSPELCLQSSPSSSSLDLTVLKKPSVWGTLAAPSAGRPCDPFLTLPLLPTPHHSFASKLWEHFSPNEIWVVLGICKSLLHGNT